MIWKTGYKFLICLLLTANSVDSICQQKKHYQQHISGGRAGNSKECVNQIAIQKCTIGIERFSQLKLTVKICLRYLIRWPTFEEFHRSTHYLVVLWKIIPASVARLHSVVRQQNVDRGRNNSQMYFNPKILDYKLFKMGVDYVICSN